VKHGYGLYMLDIASTDIDGYYRVIEANPFSTSALYECDVNKIIDEVVRTGGIGENL
jgi:hypothetical protein